ncbi:hypothetical protein D623_10001293 [Myotis brandtii]|uniref:Uncharacterized protein n=1 Tax=Myotis brandtii TaxID=109478 RepID=S7PNN3_MYOBR|nr:hypothetical protein D623_10001293 [Myotis brandtii]
MPDSDGQWCFPRPSTRPSGHPSASGSPLSGLQRLARKLEKEMKDLDSIEVFLPPTPRTWDKSTRETERGGAPWPGHPELWTGSENPAFGPRTSRRRPAWSWPLGSLMGTPPGRLERPVLLWLRPGGEHRLEKPLPQSPGPVALPGHLCSQRPSFFYTYDIFEDVDSSGQVRPERRQPRAISRG